VSGSSDVPTPRRCRSLPEAGTSSGRDSRPSPDEAGLLGFRHATVNDDTAGRGRRATPGAVTGTRSLLVLGALGPALFWILGGLAAATWPGYDPVSGSISSLVHAPHGWLQVLAFAIGAAATLAFAIGVGRVLGATTRDRTIVRVLFLLQAAIGLAFALLPTDAAGAPTTFVGQVHLANFYLYAVSMPFTLALVGRILARDPAWRPAARPTVAAASLMVVATLLVPLTVHGPLEPWLGLLERIYIAIPGAWQASVAVLVISRGPTQRP
jgi:Protein of unknown function (DUF998)